MCFMSGVFVPARLKLALPCVISSRVALPTGQVSSWATWDHLKAYVGRLSLLCRVLTKQCSELRVAFASGFCVWSMW